MSLGTKFKVEFETEIPIGDAFIEGMIKDGIGELDGNDIAKNIKVDCLDPISPEEEREWRENA